MSAPTTGDTTNGEVQGAGASEPNRIITILSPKGGAGKTSVSTNLAISLAKEHPRQVALIDLDLQFGDVATNMRLQPKQTLAHLCRSWPVDSAQVKMAMAGHHTGVYALCAPDDPAEADEILPEHVSGVLKHVHRSFKFVVVDTDPGLSERVLSALDMSTDIVMVCSTEVPSIRGLKKAVHALDMVGLDGPRRHFLLNRADAKVGLDRDDVERTIGHTIDVEVPSSIDMVLATNDGVPVVESGKNPNLVRSFEALADRFVPRAADASTDRGGLRLFKRKA